MSREEATVSRGYLTFSELADMHVGIVYHCGVISCHICTYYISENVETIVAKLEAEEKKK